VAIGDGGGDRAGLSKWGLGLSHAVAPRKVPGDLATSKRRLADAGRGMLLAGHLIKIRAAWITALSRASRVLNVGYLPQAERREGGFFFGPKSREGKLSFETTSLLLNWVQLGVLLAMLFRLHRTFDLIANTQRELRRAIHHLGDRRAAEPRIAAEPRMNATPVGVSTQSLAQRARVP